jgi:hypothetical protein
LITERTGLPLVWDRTSPDPFDWTARYADAGTFAVVSDPSLRRATDPGSIAGDASRAAVFMSDLLSSAGGQ